MARTPQDRSDLGRPMPTSAGQAAVTPPKSPGGTLRLAALAAVTVVCGLLLLEGLCSLAWLLVDLRDFYRTRPIVQVRHLEENHVEYDPVLGWRHVPGRRLPDFYGPGADLTISPEGFRGLEPVLGRPSDGRFRVVCVGDSFTLGYGVDDRQTYPHQLQLINRRVQAVNLGQGGYSVGQSHLWYRGLAESLRADAVVFAFIVDDLLRLEGSRSESGHGRPVFSLDGGNLVVSNQPVPPKIAFGQRMIDAREVVRFIGRTNALARTLATVARRSPADRDPRAQDLVALSLAMFAESDRDARRHNRAFAVVMLPTSRDLPGQEDYSRVNEQYYRTISAAVQQYAEERDIRYLDLRPAFAAIAPELAPALFLEEAYHHYSPLGNEFVARHLDDWLGRVVPGYPVRP